MPTDGGRGPLPIGGNRPTADLGPIEGIPLTAVTIPAAEERRWTLNGEGRKHRDREIVGARLTGTPVADVAARFQVSPRTVRRAVKHWRDGGSLETSNGPSTASLPEIERSIHAVARRMQRQLEKAETIEDPFERATFLARQATLHVTFVRLMEEAGFPRKTSAAWLDLPEDEWVHEINLGLRRVLGRHGVESEAIEEAVDEVVASWERRRPAVKRLQLRSQPPASRPGRRTQARSSAL